MDTWFDDLMEDLRCRAVVLSFNKVDGTEREMCCTLNTLLIPEEARPKTVNNKPADKESKTVAVYSLDDGGWRSFRKDGIIQWYVD